MGPFLVLIWEAVWGLIIPLVALLFFELEKELDRNGGLLFEV